MWLLLSMLTCFLAVVLTRDRCRVFRTQGWVGLISDFGRRFRLAVGLFHALTFWALFFNRLEMRFGLVREKLLLMLLLIHWQLL
mmetsp:Transcript_20355/g.44392  ORF Transcript_20355/g.44392 Transcript_20355/m.44392 type:complete len:84 (+) Transcript_20355:92-343(+)